MPPPGITSPYARPARPNTGPPGRVSSRPIIRRPRRPISYTSAPSTPYAPPRPGRPILRRPGSGSPSISPPPPATNPYYGRPTSGNPVSTSPGQEDNDLLGKSWGGITSIFSDVIDFGSDLAQLEKNKYLRDQYGTSTQYTQTDPTASPSDTLFPFARAPGGIETRQSISPITIGIISLVGLVAVAIIASK